MPGKTLTPNKIAEAVTLRAAGYTTTAISERLAVSVRSLHRVFERHSTKKGAAQAGLIETAKRHLLEGVTSNDRIKEEAARIVADDLAHARLIRSRIADASVHLTAGNLGEAAQLMRAAAAYSTALKNTSDMLRHSLRTERALDATEADSLPELIVRELNVDEVRRIRDSQAAEDGQPSNGEADQETDDRVSEGA